MNPSTESSKLFRAKIFHAKWRGCLPALGAALVVTLFVVFALMPMSEPGGSYESSINQALHATATPIETDSYLLRPFAWISSSLVVVLLFIITIIVSIHIVLQEVKRKSVAVPLLLLAFLTGYAGVAFYGEQTVIEWPLRSFFSIEQAIPKPPVTAGMDWLAFWQTNMLVLALCTLGLPFDSRENKLMTLTRRMQLTSYLLYLSAFTLTVSVLEVNLLGRLPGNATALGLSEGHFNIVCAGITMFSGTFFTLLLTAAFLPVLIILRSEAYMIAAGEGASTEQELRDWLKKNGLDGSWKEHLSRIAALIGPVLVGWLGEPVLQLLAM